MNFLYCSCLNFKKFAQIVPIGNITNPAQQKNIINKQIKDNVEKPKQSGAYRSQRLSESFWNQFDEMCKRLEVKPEEIAAVMLKESGLRPDAVNYVVNKTGKPKLDANGNKIPQAKGLIQIIKGSAKTIGMPLETWNILETMSAEQQLPWMEKLLAKLRVKGLNRVQIHLKLFGGFAYTNPKITGDSIIYASKAYIDAHPNKEMFKDPTYQNTAYEQNKFLDVNKKGYIAKSDFQRAHGNKK